MVKTPAESGDLYKFLLMFPDHIQIGIEQLMMAEAVEHNTSWADLVEIVMDYGRPLVIRFTNKAVTMPGKVDNTDICSVISKLGTFADDNRAGIEGTLHRISAIRNRKGDIIGLTCRVGRAITGTIAPIKELIESGKSILFLGRPGVGKAQPLDALVLTSNGYVPMGSITVGTQVIVPTDGSFATVTEIFPQGELDTYMVELNDGTVTECCKDHLWLVDRKGKFEVLALKDMMEGDDYKYTRIKIPTTTCIEFADNGSEKPNMENIDKIVDAMFDIDFIPQAYIYGSIDIRMAIIRNIFDRFGKVNTWCVKIYGVSEQMAECFAFLIRSIGGVATVSRVKDKEYECACSLPYGVKPFSDSERNGLAEKVAGILINEVSIDSITYAGKKECMCIYVDHPDHLYITDDFIVTHNTTKLREAARVLADDFAKRVVVVDTSNEIAGDGDIPHEAIGSSRRMQVARVAKQHEVMIEAVENHMPEVIIIDEIGNELEAMATRTISERGVQLIATAHGNTLEELMRNPSLNDLMGGIQSVILGDAEAKRRGTQKTVLERKQPPTFDILIELLDRHTMVIHHDVCEAVDSILRGDDVAREVRKIADDGTMTVSIKSEQDEKDNYGRVEKIRERVNSKCVKIYPYGLGRERVEQAVRRMGPTFQIAHTIEDASYVLARAKMVDRHDSNLDRVQANGATIIPVRTNNYDQILAALQKIERRN